MLKSFFIKNFRGFKELTLSSLGRVNLFVGKNNSGKSSLLEALRIYVSGAEPSLLAELTEARDESWESDVPRNTGSSLTSSEPGVKYLFHGFHLPNPNHIGIFLAEEEEDPQSICIKVVKIQVSQDKDGNIRRKVVSEDSSIDDPGEIKQGVAVYHGEKLHLLPIGTDFQDQITRQMIPDVPSTSVPVYLVPPSNMSASSLTTMWDTINLTELEDEVVKALQIIDPNISALTMVGNTAHNPGDLFRGFFNGLISESRGKIRSARTPIVRIKGNDNRIPIKNLGDGMLRMFEISLALINAKGGFLLIDEIENGLHWSIHNQLWDLIFRLSKQLDVQVFATTHSFDCFKAFSYVWNDFSEDGGFFRLERESTNSSTIRLVEYDLKTLRDSLEFEVEVR